MLPIFRAVVGGFVGELGIFAEFRRYAGHSKWQNIKHIKELKDAQKANITKGKSADTTTNLQLAHAIEMGRKNNIPVATLQNAMKLGMDAGTACKPGMLELKGPAGSSLLLQLLTDNLNRTKTNIHGTIKKTCLSVGDTFGKEFELKGIIVAKPPQGISLDTAEEHAIECDTEDVQEVPETELLEFTCAADKVFSIKNKLQELGYEISSAGREYVAKVRVTLSDSDLQDIEIALQKLEKHPDIVNIYDNIA